MTARRHWLRMGRLLPQPRKNVLAVLSTTMLSLNAIRCCLSEAGIKAQDLDYVAFYEKPLIKFERLLESYLAYDPLGIASFLKALPLWIKRKLWIPNIIQKELLGFQGKLIFPSHHESHATSAFYPSPFQKDLSKTL